MRASLAWLAVLLLFAGRSEAADVLGKKDIADLFADLQVPFAVQDPEDGEQGRVYRLRSVEPISHSASGPLYLTASVTISALTKPTARQEIERRLAAADPDTGLSYAWDYIAANAGRVAHLHAGCAFAEESFRQVAQALARRLDRGEGSPPESLWCRCGGGCRAASPDSGSTAPGSQERRLPPVRRATGDEDGEYDNRLDPSGAWTSAIGALSLMHYASGLSFAYAAVFGPTAHICEGAGVAGLVGTDRYEYVDDQGTVVFVVGETEVRMQLAGGIASFCGAAWAGDRFTIDAFEPPGECAVSAERAYFHVVDLLDPEPRGTYVTRGTRIDVAPVRHSGDDRWLLGRFRGPRSAAIGLLARRDLRCPAVSGGVPER